MHLYDIHRPGFSSPDWAFGDLLQCKYKQAPVKLAVDEVLMSTFMPCF